MAGKAKKKKKAGSAKKRVVVKAKAPAAKKPKSTAPGSGDASETLRASAKSFAARMLR